MPPANTAPAPMMANSPTSAPVKGRLDGTPVVGVALEPASELDEPPEPVNGSPLDGVGEVEFPAMDGVVEQLTPVIDPQLAAPAADGTRNTEATASPEPINRRFAHMMAALLPIGAVPLGFPSRTTMLRDQSAELSLHNPYCMLSVTFAIISDSLRYSHHIKW
jgi:hypothetical protein